MFLMISAEGGVRHCSCGDLPRAAGSWHLHWSQETSSRGGFTAVSVQMKAAWPSHEVPDKEDSSTDTHPVFSRSVGTVMGVLEK